MAEEGGGGVQTMKHRACVSASIDAKGCGDGNRTLQISVLSDGGMSKELLFDAPTKNFSVFNFIISLILKGLTYLQAQHFV